MSQDGMEALLSLGIEERIFWRGRTVVQVVSGVQRSDWVAAAVAMVVDDDVVGDGKQPGAKRPCSLARTEARQGGQRIGEDDAGGVLRGLAVSQPGIAVAVDSAKVELVERSECRRIALGASYEQRFATGARRSRFGRVV